MTAVKLDSLELSDEQRYQAWHALENTKAFLLKDRWLKGSWYEGRNGGTKGTFSLKPNHTECLANFLRRVSYGTIGDSEQGNFAEVNGGDNEDEVSTVVEGVVLLAIQTNFPGKKREITGLPTCGDEDCKKCQKMVRTVTYGPFGSIPSFNDDEATTYEDVMLVVESARSAVEPPTSKASEVMTLDEQEEMDKLSVKAQLDIDLERWQSYEEEALQRGWLPAVKARHLAKKRARWAEADAEWELEQLEKDYKEAREEGRDCVGC